MRSIVPLAVMLAFICGVPRCAHAAGPAAPAAHCAAQGTDDTLRPVPGDLAGAVNKVFGTAMPPAVVAATTVYRCAAGTLLVCSAGANLNCGKADTSRAPNEGESAWCRQTPNADFIPAYATGHETIFAWRCQAGRPVIDHQSLTVDRRGFVSQYWKPLT